MHRASRRNDTDSTRVKKNMSFGTLYATNPHWNVLGSKSDFWRSVVNKTESKIIIVPKHDGMQA
jgi:hypothetical protein